jgi:ribosomal protein L20
MNDQYSFAYEWCDIPEGMTAAEYRVRRTRPRRGHIRRLWIRR